MGRPGPTRALRGVHAPARRPPLRGIGPVHTMSANALQRENGSARGAKAKAGREPGELLQQSAESFSQQPKGNERPGAPLCVAFLVKTPGLNFVKRLDWRPMPPVRIRRHSVNRP